MIPGGADFGMAIDEIRPPGLYPGAPYAYGTVAPPGRLLFCAGACPLDEDGNVVGPGRVTDQAARAVENLFAVLAEAGAGPADVLKTTVFVASTDHADLLAAWSVIHAAFEPHEPPSTLLGVTMLGYTGQLVELEAVAAVPGR